MDDRKPSAAADAAAPTVAWRDMLKSMRRPRFVARPRAPRSLRFWGERPMEVAARKEVLDSLRVNIKTHHDGRAARSLTATSGLVRVTIGFRTWRARDPWELLRKLTA